MSASPLSRGAWQLTRWEQAAGMALGEDAATGPLPRGTRVQTARAAFEDAVLAALLTPPCVLSFSGGRDSSAVLAVATRLARREGLAMPVPVSLRFPGLPESDEDAHQESVVRHIGLAHWERVDATSDIDLLGAPARRSMQTHGVLWPANTHFHDPVARLARGGSVVTGFGGDEVMAPGWTWDRVNRVIGRQVRPRRSDALWLAAAASPLPVRRWALRRRRHAAPVIPRPWLHPEAARRVDDMLLTGRAAEAVRFDRGVDRNWWRARYRVLTAQSLQLLASSHGATMHHPFADPRFLAALAADRGRFPPADRSVAMDALFGDLLPPGILHRESKAEFGRAFWGSDTRDFVATWDGSGLDEALVRPEVLQRMWRAEELDGRSLVLLQTAWAASAVGQVTGQAAG